MNSNTRNIVSNEGSSSSIPWLWIGLCVFLLLGGLSLYYAVQKESNAWYSIRSSWMNYFFGSSNLQEIDIPTRVQDTTSPVPSVSNSTNGTVKPGETWCFVGEDNTGRWCVQVPLPSLCEPTRSYGGRSPCEMTLAQQLPIGVVTNGGIGKTSLVLPDQTRPNFRSEKQLRDDTAKAAAFAAAKEAAEKTPRASLSGT